MRHRPRTVGDPVADDREHRVATHFHFASSSFFITVFNPLTVMAFGAAFAGRDLAGVGAQPAGRGHCWWPACSAGALRLVGDHVHRRGGAAPAFHRQGHPVAEPRHRRGDPGASAWWR